MVRVRNLTIFHRTVPVVHDVTFEVKRGEVVALIGPNQSGKSTVLKAIAGGYDEFQGEIKVQTFNVTPDSTKAKMHVGYLAAPPLMEAYLTGLEWLEVVGATYNLAPETRIHRIITLAETFGCKEELYSTIERLDPAARQKIGLLASLVHEPSCVIWDEPLIFLDPESQQTVTDFINSLVSQGTSVILATNNLFWAQIVADRHLVFRDGEVIAAGSLGELHNQAKTARKDLPSIYAKLVHGA